MTVLIQVTPNKSAAIYAAAAILFERGPLSRAELFAAMDFGPANNREKKLREAFQSDWLRDTPSGQVELTEFSRRHFSYQTPRSEYVGQVTPPQYRGNVFGKPLSKKHIPNRRGPRADVPAWSVRETVTIKTIGRAEP